MTDTGYALGEGLLAALVATVTGFSSSTVTRGKWGVLNTGRAAKYAILKPAASSGRIFDTHTGVTETWATTIQIWHRYKDDGVTLTNLEADVEAVINLLDRYPHLQDTSDYVQDSNVRAFSECQEMWKRGGGPEWLRQDVTIEWIGQRIITFA